MTAHPPFDDSAMDSDAGSFIQRRLHELCGGDADIRSGLVLLSELEPGDGPQLATWPDAQQDLSQLIRVARTSMNRAHLVLARSDPDMAAGQHLVGLPLLDGERVRGALAVTVNAQGGKPIGDKMVWLARAGASMACGLFSVLMVERPEAASVRRIHFS